MRNQRGEFTSDMTLEELSPYRIAIARETLRKVLTAEFGSDGVTSEDLRWAMDVIKTRPKWAISVLQSLDL